MLIFYENTAAVAMNLLFHLFYVCVIFTHERKKSENAYSIHDDTNGKNNIFFRAYVKKTYQRGKRKKVALSSGFCETQFCN